MNDVSKIVTTAFFLISIIIPSANIYPQKNKIEFEQISPKQEYSQSSVFTILQDSRGFMWFGMDGLYRYDGYNFKVYKHNPEDVTSLSYNTVISIYEDNDGTLWIGTEGGGLNQYDREKDQFIRFIHDSHDPKSLSNNTVVSILQDKSGDLWIGTNGGGLNKLVPGDGENSPHSFIHYKHNPRDNTSLSNNIVVSIIEDKSGALWLGTGNGLNKLIPGDDEKSQPTFIHYIHNPDDPTSLSSNQVISIYEDNSGILWLGTAGGGLNIFDREKGIFTHYKNNSNDPASLSNNVVSSIYEDNSGVLWIGTLGGGLNKFDRENEIFTHYEFDPNDPNSLNGNWVYSIYEDDSGLLWIGTMPGGINKFNPQKKQFNHYTHNPDDPKSLSANRVFSIFKDRIGNLWIGTYLGGLNKLVPDGNGRTPVSFIHYSYDPNDPKSLNNNSVFSIYEDKSSNLWFGTFGGGLNKLIPAEKEKSRPKFIHYDHNLNDQAGAQNYAIRSICEDYSGKLWIGTDDGLNKIIPGDNGHTPATSISFRHNPNDPSSLSNNTVWTIYEDKRRILWIGTSGGLNKLIPSNHEHSHATFMHYTHDSNDPKSLSNNQIYSIYEDNSGNFWVGTDAGGLNKFDRENELFIRYTEKDGLPNNAVLGILEDRNGNLWLSTRNGLSRFNPKTETFRNYVAKDGLQGNEFQSGAYFQSNTGDMYFGGVNGFNCFHPDSIKDNIRIPPVVITDFQLFNNSVPVGLDTSTNRSILSKTITETKEIELTYKDYIISFEFAALDFQIPEKNKYAYILDGFDKGWNYTDANRRFATYTNLEPGEYTFRVKGTNSDGVWNEKGRSLRILVTPPWRETWWAYLFYFVFIISALYGIRRYELNRVKWKNQFKLDEIKLEERAEIDRMKSRFFANISHEFRTPLTLILGPAKKIEPNASGEEIQKQTNLIKRNVDRLLTLVNQLLDLSKLEAGKLKLNASQRNIVSFVKGILMSFESMAEYKDISLEVKAADDNIQVYFDGDKMAKILTNLLSNAFKFTWNGGEITAHINRTEQNSVEIKVRDTGMGISEEELPKLFDRFYQVESSQTRAHDGTGIGLALTKELVELHHGQISVDSKMGDPDLGRTGWTEFTIELPLGREHLNDEEIADSLQTEQSEDVILSSTFTETQDLLIEEKILDEKDSSLKVPQNDSDIVDDKTLILIVEDNSDVREYIKDSLCENFEITEATNGEQGIKKAENLIPDLIISDIMMPKMDGNELTRVLKNDEKTSHIPIILLTAKSEQESKLEGLQTGADDYLTKPFDTQELQIRIKNLINIRKKLQEKFGQGEYAPKAEGKKLSNLDEQFMCKVIGVIENHISEEEFSIEQMAEEVYMSRMQLHRKLKALTGKSASLYLRTFRLLKAKKKIAEKQGNVSEIAYSVGFSSPAYFTRCFKEEFGVPPSEFSG